MSQADNKQPQQQQQPKQQQQEQAPKIIPSPTGGYKTPWTEETRNVFDSSVLITIRTGISLGNLVEVAEFVAHAKGYGRERYAQRFNAKGTCFGFMEIACGCMDLKETLEKTEAGELNQAVFDKLTAELKAIDFESEAGNKKCNEIVANFCAEHGKTFKFEAGATAPEETVPGERLITAMQAARAKAGRKPATVIRATLVLD
jgi:hypothetical protein